MFISIGDMMQHMNNGLPFSLAYVTYDKTTGKGGAVKRVDMATKCFAKNTNDAKMPVMSGNNPRGIIKNPNHFDNSTVNIRVSAAGHADIRKVHIQLIRQFNGAIVK